MVTSRRRRPIAGLLAATAGSTFIATRCPPVRVPSTLAPEHAEYVHICLPPPLLCPCHPRAPSGGLSFQLINPRRWFAGWQPRAQSQK